MYEVECPYCEQYVELDHDDGYGYEEDEPHQQDCPKCEKTFTYTTFISFNHFAYKADCLNGGDHNYEMTHAYPPECRVLRCTMCEDEKPFPKEVLK